MFIDISVTLNEHLHIFPGDPVVRFERVHDPTTHFHLTRIQLGSHAGTHIDAPAHLLPGGATVDAIPLNTLIGPCRVIDLRGQAGAISASTLNASGLNGVQRLLLRTDNSRLWQQDGFVENYVGLTPDAARFLVECGIRLIGIDYLSIEPFEGMGEAHRILLEASTIILEGLDLSNVSAGDFELICLPLKLVGLDGSPCRAVLRKLPS